MNWLIILNYPVYTSLFKSRIHLIAVAMNWLGIQIVDNWSGCLRVILPKVTWPETQVMSPKI